MISGDFYSQGPKLASLKHADPKREYKSPSIKLLNLIYFSKTKKSFIICHPQEFSRLWLCLMCVKSVRCKKKAERRKKRVKRYEENNCLLNYQIKLIRKMVEIWLNKVNIA